MVLDPLQKPLTSLTTHFRKLATPKFLLELYKLLKEHKKVETACYRLNYSEKELSDKLDSSTIIFEWEVKILLNILNIYFIPDQRLAPEDYVLALHSDDTNISILKHKYPQEFDAHWYMHNLGQFVILESGNMFVNDVTKLVDELSNFVVGQHQAVRDVVISWKMFEAAVKVNSTSIVKVKKPSLLLQGGTGTGKTFILENLAKIVGVPFVSFDTSRLTAEGYVGAGIDDIITQLINQFEEKDATSMKAIIFLDEIDKLAVQDGDRSNVGTGGAQRNLLKLLESDTFTFDDNNKRAPGATVSLEETMFVFAGAFSAFSKEQATKGDKFSIGFNTVKPPVEDVVITEDKLIAAGLMPELVGRIGRVIRLRDLTDADYRDILTSSRSSYLNQFKVLSAEMGVDTAFSDKDVDTILTESAKLQLGARGLKTVADRFFIDKLSKIAYN